MHGFLKDFRPNVGQIGWLNPYFTRTGNGGLDDLDMGHFWIMNEAKLNQTEMPDFWPGE